MIRARVKSASDIEAILSIGQHQSPGFAYTMFKYCGEVHNFKITVGEEYYVLQGTPGCIWSFNKHWLDFNVFLKKNYKGDIKGGNI